MIGGGWIVCAFVAGACLLLLWLCSSLLLATSCCWLCYSYYIVRSRAAQLTSCQCFTSERRLLLNAISRLVVLPCCCLLPSLCFSCASSTVWRDKLTKELNSVRNLPLSCNDVLLIRTRSGKERTQWKPQACVFSVSKGST